MKARCEYNDPSNLPVGIPDDFDYGLEVGKEYLVMGIITFKDSNCLYYLIDESGRPGWYPFLLFQVTDNSLPSNWFTMIKGGKEEGDIYSLIGFDELCNNVLFYDDLTDREEEAMRTYFRRKIELEQDSF